MERSRRYLSIHGRRSGALIVVAVLLAWLLLYKLGSLVGGLSSGEVSAATTPVGWHGMYHHPLNLPLEFVRSIIFYLSPGHGQTLTRLPNTVFGFSAIISMAWLFRVWHGKRSAVFGTVLFATSAWVLHVSRLASFDVLYLWAMPTLLLIQLALQRHGQRSVLLYGSIFAWGLLLYIPGLVWLVLLSIYWQRKKLADTWRQLAIWWQRVLAAILALVWLPLLIINLQRPGMLRTWIGLPTHLASPLQLLKQFTAVFVHLFIRGPQYPDVWLGRLPILDVFTLVACVLGIYFYTTHWQAGRSRMLASFFVLGVVLVGLGGPVGISLLVPLVYVFVTTGLTYLLHDWLKTFPINPLARGLGIMLISLAVILAGLYNLRAYFIAWPHAATTRAIFRYHR